MTSNSISRMYEATEMESSNPQQYYMEDGYLAAGIRWYRRRWYGEIASESKLEAYTNKMFGQVKNSPSYLNPSMLSGTPFLFVKYPLLLTSLSIVPQFPELEFFLSPGFRLPLYFGFTFLHLPFLRTDWRWRRAFVCSHLLNWFTS